MQGGDDHDSIIKKATNIGWVNQRIKEKFPNIPIWGNFTRHYIFNHHIPYGFNWISYTDPYTCTIGDNGHYEDTPYPAEDEKIYHVVRDKIKARNDGIVNYDTYSNDKKLYMLIIGGGYNENDNESEEFFIEKAQKMYNLIKEEKAVDIIAYLIFLWHDLYHGVDKKYYDGVESYLDLQSVFRRIGRSIIYNEYSSYSKRGNINGTFLLGHFNDDKYLDVLNIVGDNANSYLWLSDAPKIPLDYSGFWNKGHTLKYDVIADINGDGRSDIIQFYNNNVYFNFTFEKTEYFDHYKVDDPTEENETFIVDNNGYGTGWKMLIKNPGIEPYRYWIGNFNGGKDEELISFHPDGKFIVWEYNENSITSSQWGSNDADFHHRYKVGDFNNDGYDDIICFKPNANFYVWLSNGVNGFNNVKKWGYNGADKYTRYMLGDFDGINGTDVIAFETDKNFYVWLSNGVNGFNNCKPWGRNGADLYPYGRYKLGDFNGDKKTDVISFEHDKNFWVWTSNGVNGFNFYEEPWGSNGADYYQRYKVCDFNGDGSSDVVSFEPGTPGIYVWLSNGSNEFYNFKTLADFRGITY
jgi:hypothetical protein